MSGPPTRTIKYLSMMNSQFYYFTAYRFHRFPPAHHHCFPCAWETHSDWKLQILAVMPICLDMVMLILNRFRIINGQISELAAIECNLKSGRGTSNFTRDYAKDVKFNHYCVDV